MNLLHGCQYKRKNLIWLFLLAYLLVAPLNTTRALASPPMRDCSTGNAAILAPRPGTTLNGVVQIEGTAALGDEFQYYKLEVAPVETEAWGDIGGLVRQPVINGQLGVWDSAAVPDGNYMIRLRAVDPTGNYCEVINTNLHVLNSGPTAVPTAADTATPTEAPPIENAVPTPLPTIEAPDKTATPGGPTATPFKQPEVTRTPGASSSLTGGLNISSIAEALGDIASGIARTFLFGVLAMAAITFLVGVIYFVRRVL